MKEPKKSDRQLDEAQIRVIQESQRKALEKVINDSYAASTGLTIEVDPPELWKFAFGNMDLLCDWAPYKQFRKELGKPTLRETLLALMAQIKDDAMLIRHLNTLLKLSERLPVAKADFDITRADSDQTKRILIQYWIDQSLHEKALKRNFCFYSDRAMAKMVYFLAHGKKAWLPAKLLNKEPERIRKLYGSLGLIPAKPRVIKDIEYTSGKIHWVPFKKALVEES